MPRAALVRTGPLDRADWNYRGLLGFVSRKRYELVRALLPREPVNRLLEIGYGSGVFLPEFRKHCRELYGVDSHEFEAEVARALAAHGVDATLRRAPAERLPFDDDTFDRIVAVSTLEFVRDLPRVVDEMSRVIKPDGRAVVVTPGDNPLLDVALRSLTGVNPQRDYGDRRARVIPALLLRFDVERSRTFPRFAGPLGVYRAVRLAPRKALALDPRKQAA